MFFIPAFYFVMRYNMHMFQLNGYKNGEHINWLKKNIRQQWLLLFGIILGVLRTVFPVLALDIFQYLTFILIILVYRAMKRLNTKKKLVYTPRVKRMITTIIMVTVIVIGTVALLVDVKYLSGLFRNAAFKWT